MYTCVAGCIADCVRARGYVVACTQAPLPLNWWARVPAAMQTAGIRRILTKRVLQTALRARQRADNSAHVLPTILYLGETMQGARFWATAYGCTKAKLCRALLLIPGKEPTLSRKWKKAMAIFATKRAMASDFELAQACRRHILCGVTFAVASTVVDLFCTSSDWHPH